MLNIEKVLSYYQECYRQEFKGGDVLNFTGAKVDKRIFLKDVNTLFTEDELSRLDNNLAEEVYKYLEIHKKTKIFLACSFFITGKLDFLGKKQTICAPLVVTPVTLELNNDGVFYFNYSFSENRINETLLNIIKNNHSLDDSFIFELKEILNDAPINEIKIDELYKVLEKYIPIENELDSLPKLMQIEDLRSKTRLHKLRLLPVVSLGIIEKSKSSKGVLNEINEIKEEHLYNETLEILFSRKKSEEFTIDKEQKIFVPSNLSDAQKNIIRSVNGNPITVVVGPPGTGKSYTIASLAIDQVYQGNSVLICSKTDPAVDVLHHKILNDIGIKGLSIRAGSGRSHKTAVRKKLESIMSYVDSIDSNIIKVQEKNLFDTFRKLDEIESEIKKRELNEIKKAELFIDLNLSFFKRIKKHFVEKSTLKEVPFWELVNLLQHYILNKNRLLKEHISTKYKNRILNSLRENRQEFKNVLTLLKSKDAEVKNMVSEKLDFQPVLECLPIWISKSTDIDTILPLEKDLFDVVIIDEASQCDIASMIPVLARAKKIVIVGDPKQLKHISFLSSESLENNANKFDLLHDVDVLNYRQTSFLDYVIHHIQSQENIHFLDEHYRSLPSIIQYSNHKFYDDRLKVMSNFHLHQKESAVHWFECSGTKNKKGINEEEVEQLLNDVKQLIADEATIGKEACTSIGILSPFRDQVNFFKKKIQEFDLADIKKHHIQAGTPFEFQGEERDCIFISWVIDNESSHSIFQYLDREDVFNVSITRAKNRQNLYYSFDPKNFKHHHLLIDYLSESKINYEHINKNLVDAFATDVYEELIMFGVKEEDIKLNFILAGYTIDLLLTHNNKTICIDLVGHPGEFEKTFSVSQYKTLFRTQVPIITIPYAYWKLKKEACLTHIKKKLHLK